MEEGGEGAWRREEREHGGGRRGSVEEGRESGGRREGRRERRKERGEERAEARAEGGGRKVGHTE